MTKRERQILNWIIADPLISQTELAEKAGITRSSVGVHISSLMRQGYIVGKGYIARTSPYVVVVGGLNVDIVGRPRKKLIPRDSNPGKVFLNFGGVGRNVAHNMRLLQIDVRFLTAFGDDSHASGIAASCGELGIDISHALKIPGAATSTYLCVDGHDGDMAVAIADMDIYERITPSYLNANERLLNNAQVIMLDTNIPQESIEWIARNCTPPIFADPVSTEKAKKLRTSLSRIHTLKPNRIEAELLSGVKIKNQATLDKAVDVLLGKGMHRVFVSLGADGVYAADKENRLTLPSIDVAPVSMTGCGDAFMGALVWAYLQGMDLRDTAAAGVAASSISLESAENVNPALDEKALRKRMKKLA